MAGPAGTPTVTYSIGHGNRSADEFLDLLTSFEIACLVDVRAYPASRRHPQFARGFTVAHIVVAGNVRSHELNKLARVREGELIYDGGEQSGLEL